MICPSLIVNISTICIRFVHDNIYLWSNMLLGPRPCYDDFDLVNALAEVFLNLRLNKN